MMNVFFGSGTKILLMRQYCLLVVQLAGKFKGSCLSCLFATPEVQVVS